MCGFYAPRGIKPGNVTANARNPSCYKKIIEELKIVYFQIKAIKIVMKALKIKFEMNEKD